MRSISRKFSWNRNPPASHKTQTIRSVGSGKSSAKRHPRGLTENRGDEEAAALLKTSKTVLRKQNTRKRACFPQDKGKQALCFPSGSFAYGHFQLHNIDPDFGFTFWAIQREIVHYRIFMYFCSCFTSTDWAMNPARVFIFSFHLLFSHLIVAAIDYSSGI